MLNDEIENIMRELFTEDQREALEKLDYEATLEYLEANELTEIVEKYFSDYVRSEWKWDKIAEAIDAEAEYMNDIEMEHDESECPIKCIYAGSMLNIYPSGKYYMPWATGNLVCGFEPIADEIYREALDDALDSIDAWQQSGDGDGLDVFFCRVTDEPNPYFLDEDNEDDEKE